jgi:Flp pilus assembly protein TadD
MLKKTTEWMDDAGLYLHYGARVGSRMVGALVEGFSKAFSVDEDIRLSYYRQKGVSSVKSGQYEKAIPLLEHVAGQQPDDREITLYLGVAYVRTGAVDEGIALLEKAATADPANPKVLTVLGLAYVQAKKFELAVPLLEKVAQANPTNFNVRFRLGVALDNLGRFQAAIDWFKAALDLRPDDAKTLRAIAYCYEQMDMHDEALPYLKKVNELDSATA